MIWDASNSGCLSGKVKRVVELTAAQVLKTHHTDDHFLLRHPVLHTEKSNLLSRKARLLPFSLQKKMPVDIFCIVLNAH